MPHQAIILLPGVNTTETPALNSAGVAKSQLIRFVPDATYGALLQKLGGWAQYFGSFNASLPIRALWAWEDTEAVSRLALGTQNSTAPAFQSILGVITQDSAYEVITPQYFIDNITPAVSTTSGSYVVTVTDGTVGTITPYDTVYITTQIAIGGLILFGLYPCNPDQNLSPGSYDLYSTDLLGNLLPASSSSTSPTLPEFSTTAGSITVTVTLTANGFEEGDTFPVLVPTEVGGIVFAGNYVIQSITDANDFTILAGTAATATTTGYLNGGNAQFIYGIGAGAIPGGVGFGIGAFGAGGFGVGGTITPATGTPINATDWFLDNWGEILIALPVPSTLVLPATLITGNGTDATVYFSADYTAIVGSSVVIAGYGDFNGQYFVTAAGAGNLSYASTATDSQGPGGTVTIGQPAYSPLYAWDPESGVPLAQPLPFGPPVSAGMFVAMPQRQIICWGSTFTGIPDPLLVRWCDVSNYGTWIAQITNQAGSYRLTRGSRIVGGIQGPQQCLLWTDVDVWAVQYIGPPYVYSFNEIGAGCGLIAAKAAATFMGIVYWMGASQFFMLSGDGVAPLPCPVWDVVFQQIDQTRLYLIRTAVNSRFGEVSWFFPTVGSADADTYVKYNAFLQVWDYGTLTRTAWVDQSVLGPPIGADLNVLYQHDGVNPTSGLPVTDAGNVPMVSGFTTGYAALSEADVKVYVDQMWPDAKWNYFGQTATNASIQITFNFTDYPNQAPQSVGPYTVTAQTGFISPRFRGRLVSITVQSSDAGSFWRMGRMRYQGIPDGRY